MLFSVVCEMLFICDGQRLFKVGLKKPISIRQLSMNTWRRWKEMKTVDECSESDSSDADEY